VIKLPWIPKSLLSRLVWSIVVGVCIVQLLGNSLWVYQIRQEVVVASDEQADNIAVSINNTLRYVSKLPASYRAIALEQLREAGGSRFYISMHQQRIDVHSLKSSDLSDRVLERMNDHLATQWAPKPITTQFASPVNLVVRENGTLLTELPDYISSQHLILSPKPAPVMVIQLEIEPGAWVFIATLFPDPFFLDKYQPLTVDRIIFQGLTVLTVLIVLLLVVVWITKPLGRLSKAAELFGRGDHHEPIDTQGTREYSRLARAFNDMEERIQRYMSDREKLFSAISHDLRTPITRLKIRTELLDDEQTMAEFEEDLADLELMVIGALQSVRESDIHENHSDVDINKLLLRLIEPMRTAGEVVNFESATINQIKAKPLALKRALTNLLDNAIQYGHQADVTVSSNDVEVCIQIRDYGPGIEGDTSVAFEPYTRLPHGEKLRQSGFGLGLNIAQSLINGHGGSLTLKNHVEQGLIAEINLPLA
jgi:signal transduction histidine kinase